MKNVRASVILASYNGEKFIGKAIASVLGQTMRDFELIVVDDASKDSTPQIIRDFQKKDSRIRFIELKTNSGGPALPRTMACKSATGDFIAFIDQDDLYFPDYLEKKIDFFEAHPYLNYVTSYSWTFNPSTRKIINYEHGGPVGMVLRRRIFDEIGYFDPDASGSDEVDFWYRYVTHYGSSGIGDMPGGPHTLYSRHPDQGSSVENKDTLSIARRLTKMIDHWDPFEIEKNHDVYVSVVYLYSRIGNLFCLAGDFKKGRDYFLKSLKLRTNLFSLLFWVSSFLGPRPYRGIEFFLRRLQRKIVWRVRAFIKSLQYSESRAVAKEILANYDNFAKIDDAI